MTRLLTTTLLDCAVIYPFELCRSDLRELLEEQVDSWPLFSGSLAFPVPHPTINAIDAYLVAERWDVNIEYGQNRRALCLWFADYLEQNLPENEK